MAIKFYKCSICNNIVGKIVDSGNPLSCCGRQMEELQSGMTDGAVEKHVPVCKIEDGVVHVKVGEQPHPMTDMHHILFIAIETTRGMQIKFVWNEAESKSCEDNCEAECCFKLCKGEKLIAAYEYCNLHGLFKCDCEC